MLFATRLCWNTNRWQSPSGSAKGRETGKTFNRNHGFGHEEWLFRPGWELGGWRYGFIQGVNKGRKKNLKRGVLDLLLYTIDDKRQRRFVAAIDEMEVLTDKEAENALTAFKANGWFDTMLNDVESAGGSADALRNELIAENIFNVRYRVENLTFYESLPPVPPTHPIQKNNRYQLINAEEGTSSSLGVRANSRGRSARSALANFVAIQRKGTAATTVDPVHNRMQQRLCIELKKEHPGLKIEAEKDNVDVRVEGKGTVWLYEIKSDLKPRSVLRQAIGQLLEYAYHGKTDSRDVVLVAVGRTKLEKTDREYLDRLREKFELTIHYRVVSGD